MTEEILSKEIAEKLMKVKGEARGATFKNDAFIISRKAGKEGVRKVEEALEEVGCPVKFSEIETFKFYPVGLKVLVLLAIKKTLGWSDEMLRDARGFGSVLPTIIRVYTRHFYSLEAALRRASTMWHEFFTTGDLTIPDYSKEKKYLIVRLKDFEAHPLLCNILEGELEFFVQMIVKSEEIECKETKCAFKGDAYHEFKVTWG